MYLRVAAVVAALGWGLLTAPAQACELDPFLFQLPGETEAEAQERSDKILADHAVTRQYNRERDAFEKATLIYLARVASRTSGHFDPGQDGPSTRVHPLKSLKGSLPSNDRTLIYEVQPGACTDFGDGQGTISPVGTLVVVFEGLPKNRERPRGVDSFRAASIRTIPLLDLLRGYGKDLED